MRQRERHEPAGPWTDPSPNADASQGLHEALLRVHEVSQRRSGGAETQYGP